MELLKRRKELEEQIAQLSRAYSALQEKLNKTGTELIKLQGALEEIAAMIVEDEIPLSPPLPKGEEVTDA